MSPDTEPADHAVLMLQRTRDLLLECRAVAQRLQVAVEQEAQAGAAERIAYGVLVAALEEGACVHAPARDGRAHTIQRARWAPG